MNYISPSSADNLELGQSARDTFGLDRAIRASKILVVDDQLVISKLLGFYLNAGGYENWTFAEDGDDALEAIEADEPDLVLLDLQMPRMGGLKVYKVLRNDPRYLMLPILVQTAADSPEDRAEVSGRAPPIWWASRQTMPSYSPALASISKTAICSTSFPCTGSPWNESCSLNAICSTG